MQDFKKQLNRKTHYRHPGRDCPLLAGVNVKNHSLCGIEDPGYMTTDHAKVTCKRCKAQLGVCNGIM